MPQPISLTIGNFDGVHRGHAALVERCRTEAGEAGRVVVMVFDPHPQALLSPESAPPPLSTFAQRERWLRLLGADEVVRLTPTRPFLSQSPEQFLRAIVLEHCPTAIIEGPDFRFGAARMGSVDTLRALAESLGYTAVIIEPVETTLTDQSIVRTSSTMVRWHVSRGRVRDASRLLGKPFEVESTVLSGEQRGRTIGFPTANLDIAGRLLPADGVYGGSAVLPSGEEVLAAISVGTNPTFDGHRRTCEAFLLDWEGSPEEYGWTLRLTFEHWIRGQIRFGSVDALARQIARDNERIRELSQSAAALTA